MSAVFPPLLLAQLAETVERLLGLAFGHERHSDLQRGLIAAAKESDARSPEAFARGLLAVPVRMADLEALVRALTVGETYFFRDDAFFHRMEQTLLPDLIRRRRAAGVPVIRIWSAGCCTGEEPYSLAMLLHALLPDRDQWNITILGTDVNPAFLARAREGKYGEWSMRALPAAIRQSFFEPLGDKRFQLRRDILRMVHFAPLNLAQDPYPSAASNTLSVDLILCRNVLMYMSPAKAEQILSRLGACLAEEGHLALAPVEATLARSSELALGAYDCPYILVRRSAAGGAAPVAPRRAEAMRPVSPPPAAAAVAPARARPAGSRPARSGEATPGGTAESRALDRLKTHPEDSRAMEGLAEAYADQGRLDEALVWGIKAAERADSPTSYYLVATILREMGRAEEAMAWLENLVAKDPGFVMGRFALGDLRRSLGGPGRDRDDYAVAARLLASMPSDQALPGSGGGMTAGRLRTLLSERLGDGKP